MITRLAHENQLLLGRQYLSAAKLLFDDSLLKFLYCNSVFLFDVISGVDCKYLIYTHDLWRVLYFLYSFFWFFSYISSSLTLLFLPIIRFISIPCIHLWYVIKWIVCLRYYVYIMYKIMCEKMSMLCVFICPIHIYGYAIKWAIRFWLMGCGWWEK